MALSDVSLLRSPAFTPPVREVPALLDLLGGDDEDLVRDVERALLRVGRPAIAAAMKRAESAHPKLRARLCRLVGKADNDDEARRFLLSRLSDEDEDPKTRRNAIIALGRLRHEEVEDALCRLFVTTDRPELLRSLAASLGKIGSARALSLLQTVRTDDPELSRIAGQATVTLDRTLGRDSAPSALGLHQPPARELLVRLHCREGLERLLLAELDEVLGRSAGARVHSPGVVTARLSRAPAALFGCRIWLRLGFPLPEEPVSPGQDAVDAVVRALGSAEALSVLSGFTVGRPRFRLAFAGGGHRRAAVWRIAREVHRLRPDIVNDPTGSPWEAVVHETGGGVTVELCPRLPKDPRLSYRRRDVPAASHPTLAAALCRVAGVRPDDVVWDPFVGSGLELCERALRGPLRSLHGSDVDQEALAAAGENLAALGEVLGADRGRAQATLSLGDARHFTPEQRPTLVLTNPPMGRRVLRGGDIGGFLDAFLGHAARVLVPGGRLSWISPLPERTSERGRRAGLRLVQELPLDMGGFPAAIQEFHKPAG